MNDPETRQKNLDSARQHKVTKVIKLLCEILIMGFVLAEH